MAWSWSNSIESRQYAQDKLRKLSQKNMSVIWAEWKTYQKAQADKLAEEQKEAEENDWQVPYYIHPSNDFDQEYYSEQLKKAKKTDKDTLADEIWEWSSEFSTCNNGGFDAWMCPYGCRCHKVPFSPEKRN